MSYEIFYSQNKTVTELDSITKVYLKNGNFQKAFNFNLEALNTYKKAGNREGIAMASINLSELFYVFGQYKESMTYLDDIAGDVKFVNDPHVWSMFYARYAKIYAEFGLFEKSNRNFDKALDYLKKYSVIRSKKQIAFFIYTNKWSNFEEMGKIDSAYKMRMKCLWINPNDPFVYGNIAGNFLQNKKNLDSAEFYLKKAQFYLYSRSYPSVRAGILQKYGDLYKAKGQNETALKYYFQSLSAFEKMNDKLNVKDIYKSISDIYKINNDIKNAEKYNQNYAYLNDSINENGKKVLNFIVDKLEKEKAKEEKEKYSLYVVLSIVIIGFVVSLYLLRKIYIKGQTKTVELLNAKNKSIEIHSKETLKLRKKLKVSYDNLAILAKKKDPFFLNTFKDIYTDFCENLLKKNPELTENDLKMCAYIKLNLTTKEISNMDEVPTRTIESRKYRLKKKLELLPKENLITWIQDL
ncbi:tetratricopeptide repeat protein [Chryseobacterium sp. MMS23-Vi53]|uniref:tetratricopeptide repeat protein n=1 Tax=Chryseobacterium sp. MMS23-Vi53 TaxID=3386644 RepID=UPI0039EA8346